MKLKDGKLTLSATDLSSHFECERKVWLGLEVAAKKLEPPGQSEIERRMLERRGRAHEAKVLEYFKAQGKQVVSLGSDASDDESRPQTTEATLQAMRDGTEVIYQGVLVLDDWTGRPDFLIRVEKKSNLGAFSYEPLDAKLARDEKARAVLQLCVYADLLRGIQGSLPECVFRTDPNADSGKPRTPIPERPERSFRETRTLIPGDPNGHSGGREH